MKAFGFHTLVFDLELTIPHLPEYEVDEDKYSRDRSIIDIGAVMLSPGLCPLDSFSSLVRPRHPITQKILDLTGYTEQELRSAPRFDDVITQFESWVNSIARPKKVRLASWGGGDPQFLMSEYGEYDHKYPFPGTTIDVKSIALVWMALAGKRNDSASLKHVCEVMKIEPKFGLKRWHTGLTDAGATADVMRDCVLDMDSGVYVDDGRGNSIKVSVKKANI